MAASRSVITAQQHGGGGGGGASNEGAQQQHPHYLQSRGNSDAGHSSGTERHSVLVRSTSSRGTSFRNTTRTPVNKHGDHLISWSMLVRGGRDDAEGGLGDREPSFALNAGSRPRRVTPDMSKGHCAGGRDPFRRSQDTTMSDAPSNNDEPRGGHGRDGPSVARESTASTREGGGTGGDRGTGRLGPGGERERGGMVRGVGSIGGCGGAGEEELSMEVPGRYERMRVLGRGSFGAVTLVKDNRDSKLYAMKTLNCADKLEEKQAAMDEVRLLRWLKHPSILTLFDTFLSADGRLVCLTTTYCESGDLAKIVKHAAKTKCPLGEKTVLGWFTQLCLGVHHLHEEKKVLHRDIKPNNIFLMDSKKIVQLGDFGLARVIKHGDKQVKTEVGTPYYTSPEMCNNLPYGFPSDVWSLGIVLFELLYLDVPFRSRDVVVLVSQVIKAPPPPLPEMYSPEATALSRWMLQKDPQRRPTLTQILACQPLRRHVNSFVKNYRPMNKSERQRRQDVKDLETQVAYIMERGGDDPQIPADVSDGCGTLQPGAASQEETSTLHGSQANAKSQPLEARGGGEVDTTVAGRAGGVAIGGGGGISTATRADRAATADNVLVKRKLSIRTANGEGVRVDAAATSLTTDADVGGGGGCAYGVGVGVGGGGGGGNTTPGGRRFGSPQPSKGARSVMSWGTPAVDKDEVGEDEPDGDPSEHRSSRLFSADGSGRRCRGEGRSGGDSSGGSDREGESRDGRVESDPRRQRQRPLKSGGSSSESLHSQCASSTVMMAHGNNAEGGDRPNDDSARRKRSSSKRFSVTSNEDRSSGIYSTDSSFSSTVAAPGVARRPSSPRSLRYQASSHPRQKSVGGNRTSCDEGKGSSAGNKWLNEDVGNDKQDSRIHNEDFFLDNTHQNVAAAAPGRSADDVSEEGTGAGEGLKKNAEEGNAACEIISFNSEQLAARSPLALKTLEAKPECDSGGAGLPLRDGAAEAGGQRRCSSSKGGILSRRSSVVAAAAAARAVAGSTAGAVAASLRPSPRTPCSPHFSETSTKTAKRLSEALTFASADSSEMTEQRQQPSAAVATATTGVRDATSSGAESMALVPEALAMNTTSPGAESREGDEPCFIQDIQGTGRRRNGNAV